MEETLNFTFTFKNSPSNQIPKTYCYIYNVFVETFKKDFTSTQEAILQPVYYLLFDKYLCYGKELIFYTAEYCNRYSRVDL